MNPSKPVRNQTRRLLCAAAVVALAASSAASAEKLYKWIDENGNVTYQDEPPPTDSGQVQTMVERGAQPAPAAATPDVAVVLYSIKACDACDLVRNLLQQYGIPFEEKNAEGDVEVQAEVKKLSGVLSVPVLAIGDQALTGYNKELILNELGEAGFSTSLQASAEPSGEEPAANSRKPVTREDLEGMTPDERQQAARDSVARGEDNDIFDEDNGFTLNEDVFPNDSASGAASDDITNLEEIPEDERIRVGQ